MTFQLGSTELNAQVGEKANAEDLAGALQLLIASYRDTVLEEAAQAAEEHLDHVDMGSQPQDHHEAPYRCNVAETIRALKGKA